MALLWTETRLLENSIIDFLQSEIEDNNITLLGENGQEVTPNVYRGKQLKQDWNLPLIQVYFDDKLLPRGEIGSNIRLKSYLILVEVRTLFPGQEIDLADWIENTLNEGCTYYTYSPDSINNDNPIKVDSGHINIDFQSSRPINMGEDVDKFDKYRYRLVLKCWIN